MGDSSVLSCPECGNENLQQNVAGHQEISAYEGPDGNRELEAWSTTITDPREIECQRRSCGWQGSIEDLEVTES